MSRKCTSWKARGATFFRQRQPRAAHAAHRTAGVSRDDAGAGVGRADAGKKALHTMREQTQRMEGLVKQLLTLSRIEAAPVLAMNDKNRRPDDAAGG